MFGLFGGGGGQGLYDAPQQPMQQTNPFTRGPVFGGGSGGFGGGFGGFGGFQQQSPYMGGQGFGGGYGGFNPFQQQMQMQNPFMGGQGFGGFGGFQQPMQQQYMPQQSFYGFGPGFGYGGQNQFDPRMQNPYGPPPQQQQPFQLPQQLQQMPQPSQAMPFSQPPQRQYADFQRQAQQGQGNSQQFGQGQMSDDAARRYMMQGKQQQLAQPQPQPSGDTFLGMPVGGGQASPQMNSLMDTIARNSMSQPMGTPQQPRGARQFNMPQRSMMSQALAQQAAQQVGPSGLFGLAGLFGGYR